MELTDQAIIAALLGQVTPTKKLVRRKRDDIAAEQAEEMRNERVSTKSRCKCGTCSSCIDNAKWERIFNEKFADPTYYSARSTGFGSSLASL